MSKKKTINIGEFIIVKNKAARSSANSSYMFGVVRDGGNEVQLMLTMAEYSRSMARAGKNPEDCIKRFVVNRPKKKGFMAWLKRHQKKN
jgi:hypothetical protein